jgi:hypothetical protein
MAYSIAWKRLTVYGYALSSRIYSFPPTAPNIIDNDEAKGKLGSLKVLSDNGIAANRITGAAPQLL